MYILFFLVWIIFNGTVTAETIVFGLVISAAMYLFICKFMDYSIRKDIVYMKCAPCILRYICVLVWEIIKANFAVIKLMTASRYELEPVLVRFKINLKTKLAKVVLANSITLTPGTITVTLEGDEYVVHCLDKELAEGMNHSIFVDLLKKLEERM
jgi:Multisubunit Na+/H+ antiporter, MnhE subunit